jgi:hypothetical protein
LGDAGTELWIDLEEVLELSLLGGAVDGAHVSRDVVHKTLSLALVEDFVEEGAWLLIDSVRVSVRISGNWAGCWLGVDGVLLVFAGGLVLRWLVVGGFAVTVHVHDSVALVIGGSESGSVWAVDWNLVVVGAEAMSVGVRVVNESTLEHLAVGSLDAWDEVSWRESGLLGLGVEVLWVLVESKFNDKGEPFLVKYHFKTDQGIKNFSAAEAAEMGKNDKDFATRDLFENIQSGNFPSWTMYVQVMTLEEGEKYKYDVYDITKTWSQADCPLIKVGKLTLNQNPENFHAEAEQSAFSPAHFVPGIEASNCKMLQGRLVNYSDTHRHRLGSNHHQIPINCPYRARLGPAYNQRDGVMNMHSYGKTPNYEPSQHQTASEDKQYAIHAQPTSGPIARYAYTHPNTVYEQPRTLFNKVFDEGQRQRLMDNISGHMSAVDRSTKERQLQHFFKVDPKLGAGIAQRLGMPNDRARL